MATDTTARVGFAGLTLDGAGVNDVTVTPGDLPDAAAAFRNLDVVVLAGLDGASFTADQTVALDDWISTGGVLVVMGGTEGTGNTLALPADMRPVKVTGATTLATLSTLGAAVRTPSVPVSTAAATSGARVIDQQDGVPLIVDLPHGEGHIVYVALDPLLAPLTTWNSTQLNAFWSEALGADIQGAASNAVVQSTGSGTNSGGQNLGIAGSNNPWELSNTLSNLPANGLPSWRILGHDHRPLCFGPRPCEFPGPAAVPPP